MFTNLKIILLLLCVMSVTYCGHRTIRPDSPGSQSLENEVDLDLADVWNQVPSAYLDIALTDAEKNNPKFSREKKQAEARARIFRATSQVVQPDGKIVTAGEFSTSVVVAGVKRSNADGSPDPTFGDNGQKVSVLSQKARQGVTAMDLQSDGKIVVVAGRFTVARYKPDGTLDSTFGTGGICDLDLEGYAYAVKVLADNSILVGGSDVYQATNKFVLAKVTTNGVLDTQNFARPSGYIKTLIKPNSWEARVSAIAVQSSGKILVGGYSNFYPENGMKLDATIARYSKDGTLDSSFGTNGFFVTNLDSEWSRIMGSSRHGLDKVIGLNVQRDNSIIVSTFSNGGGFIWSIPGMFGVYQLDAEGKRGLNSKEARKGGEFSDSYSYKVHDNLTINFVKEDSVIYYPTTSQNSPTIPPVVPPDRETPPVVPPDHENPPIETGKPCAQIMKACEQNGFRSGSGLYSDCYNPLLQGRRVYAKGQLVVVDPAIVAQCKAKNPN